MKKLWYVPTVCTGPEQKGKENPGSHFIGAPCRFTRKMHGVRMVCVRQHLSQLMGLKFVHVSNTKSLRNHSVVRDRYKCC